MSEMYHIGRYVHVNMVNIEGKSVKNKLYKLDIRDQRGRGKSVSNYSICAACILNYVVITND